MNIDMIKLKEKKEIRKCFKYENEDHIKRFYRVK